jgi:hypothetical protein
MYKSIDFEERVTRYNYNEISGKSSKLWRLSIVYGDISAAVVNICLT